MIGSASGRLPVFPIRFGATSLPEGVAVRMPLRTLGATVQRERIRPRPLRSGTARDGRWLE